MEEVKYDKVGNASVLKISFVNTFFRFEGGYRISFFDTAPMTI